jgi:hypothetical protein
MNQWEAWASLPITFLVIAVSVGVMWAVDLIRDSMSDQQKDRRAIKQWNSKREREKREAEAYWAKRDFLTNPR